MVRIVLAVTAIALAAPPLAAASRPPTRAERAAITTALPADIRRYPVGCVWLDISVSRSGAYARVAAEAIHPLRMPCLRYAGNGFFILKRLTRWTIVFTGSDLPCSRHVPRDLAPCSP